MLAKKIHRSYPATKHYKEENNQNPDFYSHIMWKVN